MLFNAVLTLEVISQSAADVLWLNGTDNRVLTQNSLLLPIKDACERGAII